jgi:hypothetical protein
MKQELTKKELKEIEEAKKQFELGEFITLEDYKKKYKK